MRRGYMSRKASGAVAALLAISLPVAAHAAIAPYSENFDDDTIGTDTPTQPAPNAGSMTPTIVVPTATGTSGTGSIAVTAAGSGNVLSHNAFADRGTTATSSSTVLSSGVQLSNVPGINFTLTTDAAIAARSVSPNNPNSANFGPTFLAPAANSANAERYNVYLASAGGAGAGRISLTEQTGSTTATLASSSGGTALTMAEGATYNFVITGTYAEQGNPASALTITATVTGSAGGSPQTISFVDTTPRTGSYFGYRTGLNVSSASASSATLNVTYDNFAVAPEPATLSLLGMGLITLLGKRQRRRG